MSETGRKPLMSGNWKMHHNHFEAIAAVQKLSYNLTEADYSAVDVSIHPPFTDLRSIQTIIDADKLDLLLGAQHCHWEEKGAFTGEIAPGMLADIIGVPGDPLVDVTTFQRVPFVMKDGSVVKHRT